MLSQKPLIERYIQYMRLAKERAHARIRANADAMSPRVVSYNFLLSDTFSNVILHLVETARKYRLACSAQTMIEALRPRPLLREEGSLRILDAIAAGTRPLDSDIATPLVRPPSAPIWIEFEQPLLTTAGEIAGIFFTSTDHEIDHQLATDLKPDLRRILEETQKALGNDYRWHLYFIYADGTPVSYYVYHEAAHSWSITPDLAVDVCPTGQCIIEGDDEQNAQRVSPCAFCSVHLAYWRSWLATALLALQGEFAETEQETTTWPVERVQAIRKVQRAASAKYDDVRVEHDYYLVKFDASVRRRRSAPCTEGSECQTRGSWIAASLEVDPEAVVYIRRDFGATQRCLDPERNPRWRQKQIVGVSAHTRRVPMRVDRLQKRLTRVIASTYENG